MVPLQALLILLPEGMPPGRAAARAGLDGALVGRHRGDLGLDEDDEPAGGEDAANFFEEEGVVADL